MITEMFEMMLSGGEGKGGGIGSGGPEVIIGVPKGDFLGEVTAASFVTGPQLADAIGITQGTVIPDSGWLKFTDSVDGLTKYISKKPLRSHISWDQIHSRGAVFGSKTVVINGDTYKVRLLSGANSNPATAASGYDAPHTHGCEWNRLMYRISAKPFGTASNTLASEGIATGDWASYSEKDLVTYHTHGNGSYCWCQETGTTPTTRVYRGNVGVSLSSQVTSSFVSSNFGWRVCLELVP